MNALKTKLFSFLALLLVAATLLSGCSLPLPEDPSTPGTSDNTPTPDDKIPDSGVSVDAFDPEAILAAVPAFSDKAFVNVNDGKPFFTESDYTTEAFEKYAALDSLGRCGITFANVCKELMPTEERGSISSVKPSGWHTVKYDIVDGKYLYNRCHLIGYQLTGENANRQNLITGTRYLNIQGMLPYENMVADYVKETGNHVLYRSTPIFHGDELVARGVLIEGYSVEDNGEGISFCVYCYNSQPGITIDYATGESHLSGDTADTPATGETEEENTTYILNVSGKKFHLPTCSSVSSMKEENKRTYTGTREDLIEDGYSPCGACKP